MPYLGNPAQQRFSSPRAASVYSGDGSTVAFTLEEVVSTDEDILVSVDGVIQEPSVAYAVSSGTTLTFTAAPSSNAGNNIFVYYIARTFGSISMPDGQNVNAATASFSGAITAASTLAVTGTSTLTGTVTANGDMVLGGTTPTLTIGDGGAEDTAIIFDGNAQDFYIGLDDTNDNLSIGLGTTIGGTQLIKMTSGDIVINEDSANIDFRIESDSDANMFHLDAGENKIKIGTGASNSGYISIRSTIDDGQSRAIFAENYQDGNPSANDVVMVSAQYSNFTGTMLRIHHEVENANQLMIKVDTTGSNTVKFSVDEDGDVQSASNSYGSTSDERIKQDIVDANSQWDDIKAIKIRNYKRKTVSNPKTEIGVIAQELETAGMDGLVKESNPSVADIEVDSSFGTIVDDDSVSPNPDGSKKRKVGEVKAQVKEVKYSVLYMKSIKALQEAMTRIETLEAKVKVLEG